MFNAPLRLGISSLLAMAEKVIFTEGGTVIEESSRIPKNRHERIPKNRHERKNMLIGGFNDIPPSYYPGAKLARKASKGTLGIATLR